MAFHETIIEDEEKDRLAQISKDKDWPLELAAVAAKAGDGADHIIEKALKKAAADATKKIDRIGKKGIEELRTRYAEAMNKGNVQEAILAMVRKARIKLTSTD